MIRRSALTLLIGGGVIAFGIVLYSAGWHAGSQAVASHSAPFPPITTLAQSLPQIQEFIPLPGPDRQGQGEGQDCEPVILFYHQGRLYQLFPGPLNQQGQPSSPPEYFQLRPYRGPQVPGLPFGPLPPRAPQTPGFEPVNPRF